MSPAFEEVARSKAAERDARIPSEWRLSTPPSANVLDVTYIPGSCGLLTMKELEITERSPSTLVDELAKGEWSAVEVTTAFCKRAAIAQQLVNAITEFFPEEALETARAADDYLAKHGKPIGPLHGLPISIKDNFKIKGHASSVGFTAWANEVMAEDSELVRILREAGAILYCKTNISEGMMIAESYNNVWGRSVNAQNRSLSCGGSSGGEGVLVKLRGSPLGVGTDIGGSVRIPAACNGVFGLKPSLGRFPTYNARSGMAGQEAVASINGPIANSLDGLELYAKAVIAAKPWLTDPKMIPIPWRTISLPSQLTFGVIYDDGNVRPAPPYRRALQETVEKLRRAGHEVIEWDDAGLYAKAASLLVRLFTSDGGVTMKTTIEASDEPWPKGLAGYEQASKDRENDLVYRQWNATASMTKSGRPMDALLTPPMALPPPRHDQFRYVGYTCLWNICDQSAVILPVTSVDKTRDVVDKTYQPRNADDKAVYEEYDPEVYHGAPITLQLVTRRLEEEKALAITKVICDLL